MTGGTKGRLASVLLLNQISVFVVVMLIVIKYFLDLSRGVPDAL